MDTDKSKSEKEGLRFAQWVQDIEAYMAELQHTDAVTRQLQSSVRELHFQKQTSALRNQILMLRGLFGQLMAEVEALRTNSGNQSGVVTMGYIIANNKLRDRIRKAGQEVFLIKQQVHQLLSIAS